MNITFQMYWRPKHKGGLFEIAGRVPKDVFYQIKMDAVYYSPDEVEDGVTDFSGWHYTAKSVIAALKSGHTVTLMNADVSTEIKVQCSNVTQLNDCCEQLHLLLEKVRCSQE